ncbi:MAG: glutamate--cysteine ligase [Janthinobacterium lividum]
MSNPGEADATPIASTRQLAEHIAVGCKPRDSWRIGTEHEKFGFRRPARPGEPAVPGSATAAYEPPGYAPDGIRAVLDGIAARGWTAISDAGSVIGLSRGGASVSLEPAGQFELSGAPLATLHETRAELDAHFADVHAVARPMGLGFAPLGFHPTGAREAMPWMPKSRYAIMRRYMQRTGTRGLDMMLRTCTVQVNLDYGSEADMVRKLRVGLLLQPVATALFANSPFTEGRPNGFLSARANVWLDTDADRTGIPAVVFEDGFGFERYVEWLLDVPMYFVMRDGGYVDLAGRSFRDFMAGRLSGEVAGEATLGDFADHMTTSFTEVRLKRFLEMRGADAGTPEMMLAQSALWVGLLYDEAALSAAVSLVGRHPWQAFAALREHVPTRGLDTPWATGTLRDVARDVVAIARDGLRARGHGEEALLAPLHAIVAGGPTQAEHWLARFHGAWGGDVRRVFDEAEV